MRLVEVEMTVRDVDAAATFYRQALELPVAQQDGAVLVRVGWSTLTLIEGLTGAGSHHLAITVPADQFGSAKRWLSGRLPLLHREGVDEFSLPPPWNSESIYFLGPEDVLLELIARHDLPTSGTQQFTPDSLLGVSEVGVAVDDVDVAAAAVHAAVGLDRFGSGGSGFLPIGDNHGLLILVATGRTWFPTTSMRPSQDPLVVTLDPGRTGPETSVLLGSCTLRSAGASPSADARSGH